MSSDFFEVTDVVNGCAIFVGQQIKLKKLQDLNPLANSPLTLRIGNKGVGVLFRYGVVVIFGLDENEISRFVTKISNVIVEPFKNPEKDYFQLSVDTQLPEGSEFKDIICLHSYNLQVLQVVADVLAKSTVLSHYEFSLTRHFDRIEPLAERLKQGHHGAPKGRDLLQHIGDTLLIEAKMTARIQVSETPELIWDYPQYERLYLRMQDEFDLLERCSAIDRKLGLISKTAQTLLDLIHNERSLRVEWYIVILILVDIVIAFIM